LQDSDAHTYDCVAALALVRVSFGDILGCNTDLELHRIERKDVQHYPSTLEHLALSLDSRDPSKRRLG
jgi:hypothetical protein